VVTKVGSQVGAALDELLAETPNVPSSKKVALRTDGIKIFQALEIFNGADRHSEYRKTFKDYPLSESFDRANVDQAVRTLKTMAQGGNSYAAVVLADRLTWGNVGLKQDARQAFEMARKAAELGNPYGYYLVSDFCSRGVGTQKDESESFRYTVLAAENDVAEAQLSLAEIYAHGSTLVNQDLAKAYMLMSLSATNMRFPIFSGESKQFAAKLHDEVTRKMTPAQMQAAQEQTSEWTKIKRRALPQLRWQGEAAGVKEFMEPLIGQVLAGSGIR
jgi:TPR repeat protein